MSEEEDEERNDNKSVLVMKYNDKDINDIKEKIKKIDWDKISTEWNVMKFINRPFEEQNSFNKILLNPKLHCSKSNPLYMHKKWLEHLYNFKDFSDRLIAKICSVDHTTISYWRKKNNIPTRLDKGSWIDTRSGKKMLYMPEDYQHPELVPIARGEGRYVRPEHIVIMENYLMEHPELEISKKYLINSRYLKIGCIIHHINYNPQDNRIENLWLFEDNAEHNATNTSLFNCFSDLIKLNQISFEAGIYYVNKNFDYRNLDSQIINETLRSNKNINQYADIGIVKETIKEINWDNISDDWTVKHRQNQFVEYTYYVVNPRLDCLKSNPLYLHKVWLEHIINDNRFNLTDSRLSKLCEISKDQVRYYRRKFNISGKEDWGFKQFIKNDRVWIKVPKNYENPIAEREGGYMLEHRYLIECYLREHPELEISKRFLNRDGYLYSDCEIHHINFDSLDNRLENLWICENGREHKLIEGTLLNLVKELMKLGLIFFIDGRYSLNYC